MMLMPLSGCTSSQPTPTASGPSTATAQATAKPATPARPSSESSRTLNTWLAEVSRRVEEYDKKSRRAAAATPAGLPSDVAAIAASHPAWQLADALQRVSTLPATTNTRPLSAVTYQPARIRETASGSARHQSTWGRNNWAGNTALQPFGVGAASTHGNESIALLAAGLPDLQQQMRLRQERSLDAFLYDAALFQSGVRQQDRASLLAAMQEDIELTQQVDLDALEPTLPPEAVQLEMTNLRLRLLKNVELSDAERAEARERLRALQIEWRRMLREQERQRRELLTRLREERPRQIETQRSQEIATFLNRAKTADEQARVAVREAQRQRIAADFNINSTRLGIALPTGNRLTTTRGLAQSDTSRDLSSNSTFRTLSTGETSFDSTSITRATSAQLEQQARSLAATLTPAQLSAEISRLRALAWNDARQWGRIIARRNAAVQNTVVQNTTVQSKTTALNRPNLQ
jgi:hypothetical protein